MRRLAKFQILLLCSYSSFSLAQASNSSKSATISMPTFSIAVGNRKSPPHPSDIVDLNCAGPGCEPTIVNNGYGQGGGNKANSNMAGHPSTGLSAHGSGTTSASRTDDSGSNSSKSGVSTADTKLAPWNFESFSYTREVLQSHSGNREAAGLGLESSMTSGMAPPQMNLLIKQFISSDSVRLESTVQAWETAIQLMGEGFSKGTGLVAADLPPLAPLRSESEIGAFGAKVYNTSIAGQKNLVGIDTNREWWRQYSIATYAKDQGALYARSVRRISAAFDGMIDSEVSWSKTTVSSRSDALYAGLVPEVEKLRAGFDRNSSLNSSKLRQRLIPLYLQRQLTGDYLLTSPAAHDFEIKHKFSYKGPLSKDLRETYEAARTSVPISFQGKLARELAIWLAVGADGGCHLSAATCKRHIEFAKMFIDLVTGSIFVVGVPRDIYEAYTGEDLISGERLNDFDCSVRILSAASFGVTSLIPTESIREVITSISRFRTYSGRAGLERAESFAKYIAELKASPSVTTALNEATRGKLGRKVDWDITVGLTRDEMDIVGLAWVGPDHAVIRETQKTLRYVSRDQLREFRPPTSRTGDRLAANLSEKVDANSGIWTSNAHVRIIGK